MKIDCEIDNYINVGFNFQEMDKFAVIIQFRGKIAKLFPQFRRI